MLAAVYHGPRDVRVETYPKPEISPDEVLLRVIAAGICGTDLRIFHGDHRKYPAGTTRVPGHEVVGEIAEVGKNVKGLEVGQRMFVAPNMGCGHCRLCISGRNNLCAEYDAPGITFDGAFAEFMRIPAAAVLQGNLIPIDENTDPVVAALIEPFACVLRGQDALNIQPGDTVLVVGAGPIGLMHIMLANLRGAGTVIASEVNPDRYAQIADFGPARAVNPAEESLDQVIFDETHSHGADVIIIAAPAHQAQEEALALAAIGGRINYFGGLPKDRPTIQFDSNLLHYKELVVTGTTACSTNDCRRATEIASSGRIDLSKMIGVQFPLKEAADAFLEAETGRSLRVMIRP